MDTTGQVFRITDFGAVADGKTLNTKAIQAALDAAAVRGGEVIIPAGSFLTGTVFLRSHTTLNLLHGAQILGSPRLTDYIPVRWGHHMDRTPWHLIMADNVEDITIKGQGEINGNGPHFWEPTRPSDWHFWTCKWDRPSPMVEITNCRDVRIENITLRNPAGWTLHLHDTTRAWIRGVRIDVDLFGPNSDGIDLTGARDVMISDCHTGAPSPLSTGRGPAVVPEARGQKESLILQTVSGDPRRKGSNRSSERAGFPFTRPANRVANLPCAGHVEHVAFAIP
jgi:polygalacturonase